MKKKIFAFAAGVCMLVSLTACGGDSDDKKTTADVKIGQYKGIEVGESVATITDKEFKDYVDFILDDHKVTENVDKGTTKKDDKILAVYTASQDGKEVSALSSSSSGSNVTLSDDGFVIDGFVDNLIGKNVGDKVEFDVKIAEDSTLTDYRGQTVHYAVEIKAIIVTTVPELTDEWVKSTYAYLGLNNVDEFNKYFKADLYVNTVYGAIESKLLEGVTVNSYDSDELKEVKELFKQQFKNQLSYYGIELDAYLQAMEKTEDTFEKEMEEQAKTYLKGKMFILKVAELENIEVSDEEYTSDIVRYAKEVKLENESELMSYYNGVMDKDDFRYSMIGEKVQKFIADNIKVVPDSETDITEAATTKAEGETKAEEDTTVGE